VPIEPIDAGDGGEGLSAAGGHLRERPAKAIPVSELGKPNPDDAEEAETGAREKAPICNDEDDGGYRFLPETRPRRNPCG